MKKRALCIAAGYIAIILCTVIAVIIFGRSYSLYVPNPHDSDKYSVVCSDESVLESTSVQRCHDFTRFTFRAVGKGSCLATVTVYSEENENNYTVVRADFTVLPSGVLFCCASVIT